MISFRLVGLGIALTAAPAACAQTDAPPAQNDLSGTWAGATTCPLGRLDLTVEIAGMNAIFRSSGYDPSNGRAEDLPVTLRFMTGEQGTWVYLENAERQEYHSGLLTSDERFLQMGGMGDCEDYVLTRTRSVAGSASAEETSERCGATPTDYEGEFGPMLFALITGCKRDFSQREQLFIAGLSDRILSQCDVPSHPGTRTKLLSFITASAMVPSQTLGDNIADHMRNQVIHQAALVAGVKAFDEIGCGRTADRIASSVAKYLGEGANETERSVFVRGCADRYAGTYTVEQCQCVGDLARTVFPQIHGSAFDRGIFKRIAESNPLLGLNVAMQCGIGDY
jgi:hypothetical protein